MIFYLFIRIHTQIHIRIHYVTISPAPKPHPAHTKELLALTSLLLPSYYALTMPTPLKPCKTNRIFIFSPTQYPSHKDLSTTTETKTRIGKHTFSALIKLYN